MTHDIDTEPVIIKVPASVSLPPGNITPGEWLTLLDEVDTLRQGHDLGDLNDVDTTGADDGEALILVDGTWRPGTVQSGFTLASVSFDPIATGVVRLVPRQGLGVGTSGTSGTAYIQPVYGTSANTVAEGNHAHALPTTYREPITPQDYMSSGTRPLASRSVTLPAGKTCKVEAWFDPLQIRGGDTGPCYYRLSITIDGNTRQSPAPGPNGYWVVQGVPKDAKFGHERNIAGTGAAITVSASIAWGGNGGGFNTDAGELVIRVTPNR